MKTKFLSAQPLVAAVQTAESPVRAADNSPGQVLMATVHMPVVLPPVREHAALGKVIQKILPLTAKPCGSPVALPP